MTQTHHRQTILTAFIENFLGHSPDWYKGVIFAFLLINPIALIIFGPKITGWFLVIEFIFTLAMALKCYPLQPGGLLAIEAVVIGLTNTDSIKHEVFQNFPVILLLMFMVAGIYFMKDLILYVFSKILLHIKSKTILSLLFCFFSAFLSAFLDALTVTAVLISVGLGFYSVYHKVASGKKPHHSHEHHELMEDQHIHHTSRDDLKKFRAFLRSLLMHGAVGTALGGVFTTVGEPQNLLIAGQMGWDFLEFVRRMLPVSGPVLLCGLLTCILLENFKWFGYGEELPEHVRSILQDFNDKEDAHRTTREKVKFVVQGIAAIFLVFALAFHVAEVGIIGLTIIILQTAFNGTIEEHQIGKAFEEALPFTALLIVFFTIVAVIHDQHLFNPVIHWVLSLDVKIQPGVFFLANGLLSAISDNVFVATIYINEVKAAFVNNEISREHFNSLAIAINTGTNLPSVATPNGQAAFLFLLTSTIAPLLRLSYGRMVYMALPYTFVLALTGFICVLNYL